MNKLWQYTHKASTDSVTSVTGFHGGYSYKIVNQEDDSVIHLNNFKSVPGVPLVTEECQEDAEGDCQKFKATRIREGEKGGEFEIQSLHQDPKGPLQVWEYNPEKKILIQNSVVPPIKPPVQIGSLPLPAGTLGSDPNQLWIAVENTEGSRVYFIKPASEDVCLTNMGIGQPIALYPPDPSDSTQLWVLDPIDYTE